LKTFFLPEGVKIETVVQSEPEVFSYKAKSTLKPKNSKSKAMTNSDSKTSKIKFLKRSEPVPQSLLKPESGILKSKSRKNKIVVASSESELKGVKPKVLINQKLSKPHLKVQEVKSKTSSTNLCNALISNLLFLVVLHNLFEFMTNHVICGVLFDLYSFI